MIRFAAYALILMLLLPVTALADEQPIHTTRVSPFVGFIHFSAIDINTMVVGLELTSRPSEQWTLRIDFGYSMGTPPSGAMARLLGAPWLNYAQIMLIWTP